MAAESDTAVNDEWLAVEAWRLEQLQAAGFHKGDALVIAASHVDYHKAIRMLEAGCPSRTVAAILRDD